MSSEPSTTRREGAKKVNQKQKGAIIALREAGFNYPQICTDTGVSVAQCCNIYKAAKRQAEENSQCSDLLTPPTPKRPRRPKVEPSSELALKIRSEALQYPYYKPEEAVSNVLKERSVNIVPTTINKVLRAPQY
jgi:hypothetical protein